MRPMNRGSSRKSWLKLAIGGALVISSMLIFYTTYGSGPTFPPVQFYTWPVTVVGGIVVGYAVAELAAFGDRHLLRIGLALVGGMIAWTGQLVIQSFVNPAITFSPADVMNYRIGLAIAVFVVVIVEGAVVIKRRRSITK